MLESDGSAKRLEAEARSGSSGASADSKLTAAENS